MSELTKKSEQLLIILYFHCAELNFLSTLGYNVRIDIRFAFRKIMQICTVVFTDAHHKTPTKHKKNVYKMGAMINRVSVTLK